MTEELDDRLLYHNMQACALEVPESRSLDGTLRVRARADGGSIVCAAR